MHRLDLTGLPDDPIAAAATFYAEIDRFLPRQAGEDLALIFPSADHIHSAWRLAVIQSLARARVPGRVNGVASASEAAIGAALAFLATAPGLTGQYLPLDDSGAGAVIPSAA